MGITGSIIVYVIIWWIIFFSVLPVGIQSNKETFKEKIEGIDPGAPKNPKIANNYLNPNELIELKELSTKLRNCLKTSTFFNNFNKTYF